MFSLRKLLFGQKDKEREEKQLPVILYAVTLMGSTRVGLGGKHQKKDVTTNINVTERNDGRKEKERVNAQTTVVLYNVIPDNVQE